MIGLHEVVGKSRVRKSSHDYVTARLWYGIIYHFSTNENVWAQAPSRYGPNDPISFCHWMIAWKAICYSFIICTAYMLHVRLQHTYRPCSCLVALPHVADQSVHGFCVHLTNLHVHFVSRFCTSGLVGQDCGRLSQVSLSSVTDVV